LRRKQASKALEMASAADYFVRDSH
jgi:hypothetical protein